MFSTLGDFNRLYLPILFISPSEMLALENLPEKEKDGIVPIFALKGWVGSKNLHSSVGRIEKSIGQRPWIADLDREFLEVNRILEPDGNYSYKREVFYELEKLTDSSNGYENWCNYVQSLDNVIPVVQTGKTDDLEKQIQALSALNRGIVLRFDLHDIIEDKYLSVIKNVVKQQIEQEKILILFDFEQIEKFDVDPESVKKIQSILKASHAMLQNAYYSISASSFPSSFSPYTKGENPIYERLLFNRVKADLPELKLIYSDRGSARIDKNGGGGGIPSPRIDYPLLHDWRFIRKEFDNPKDVDKDERLMLYSEAAGDVISSTYWDSNLKLWGTQLIELTAKGDKFGIGNPAKATAARINIHLHNQLMYNAPEDEFLDTEEDWVDL